MTALFRSEWLFFVFASTFLLGMAEVGFRAGRRLFQRGESAQENSVGSVQAAVLGLLSLLLGFTFAVAFSRYDTRRQLVIKEANAIGTTWLRASLLPEAERAPVRDLLRRYVKLRVDPAADLDDPLVFRKAVVQNDLLQNELWQNAEAASREAASPITALFVSALNDTFDASSERIAASMAFIPSAVSFLLLTVAAVGCFISNYDVGLLGRRFVLQGIMLPLLMSFSMLVIFDFVRSRRGMIRIDVQPLIELQASMQK